MSDKKVTQKPRSDFNIEDFPTLERAAKDYDAKSKRTRYYQHLVACVANLSEGVEAGGIRNAVFVDSKHTLGSIIYHVWRKEMGEAVHANESEWDYATRDVLKYLPFSGINDIRALGNKLKKLKQSGPHKVALQGFVDEMQPLIEAVEYLKDHLIKGRAPSTKPAAPVNPDKDVKTCPCCFRSIAVRAGKMVHHGYDRPGNGHQTASCWGIEYPPLEISTAGLEWLISFHDGMLKEDTRLLRELPKATKISFLVQKPKLRLETITPEDEGWHRAYEIRKGELEGDIRNRRYNLTVFRRHLKEWIKWHQDRGTILDIAEEIKDGDTE